MFAPYQLDGFEICEITVALLFLSFRNALFCLINKRPENPDSEVAVPTVNRCQ